MKKILSWILVFSVFSGILPVFAEEAETVNVEYIIRYDTERSISAISEEDLSTAAELMVVDEFESTGGSDIQLVSISTNDADATLAELNNTEGIAFAEPNYTVHTYANDPGFKLQWGLTCTAAEKAWEITAGSGDVTVAVIDTGVDINHPDLSQNIFTNTAETQDGTDTDGNGYKDDIHGWDFSGYENAENNGDNTVYDGTIIDGENSDSHGTHVAGIIAASLNGSGIQGMAPNVKILPVKFITGDEGTIFNAIKAIEYAEMMGADIANCSWGSGHYSQFLYDCIRNSSMLFVCAAGNYGVDVNDLPEYPAMYGTDNVISVAAFDSSGNIADFSNYGEGVNIAAPGEEIYSTLPENTYGYKDGTSMAAPFVSGAAALMLSMSPDIQPGDLKKRIIETASEVEALAEKTDASGTLNAYELLLTEIEPVNLSSARYGAESVVLNNGLYIAGGYDGGEYLKDVDKYNPETRAWQTVAELPSETADCATAAEDGKIYIAGGYNGEIKNTVHIYDTVSDTWQNGAEMPEALYGTAYALSDSKLYIFGGIGNTGFSKSVYEYNIQTDIWTKKNDLPQKIAYGSAVCAGGVIYLLGGNNENGCLDSVYSYDADNDEWNYEAKMSVSRRDFAAVCADNKIYIFGGSGSFSEKAVNPLFEMKKAEGTYIEAILDTAEVFDINTGVCTAADTLTNPSAGSCAVNYFGNIYLLGGWDGECIQPTAEYFGAEFPKNIRLTSENGVLTVKWKAVPEASGYNVEIDGTVYSSEKNSYSITVDESIQHKVRVQSVKNGSVSLWSDYIYHYLNSTMADAKLIEVNSVTNDKMYCSGQTKWYKLNNSTTGQLSLTLSDIPDNCSYSMQLCDMSGMTVASGEENNGNIAIDNFTVSQYTYYVRIHSNIGYGEEPYTLTSVFEDAEEIPDRIRSAVIQPSSFSDNGNDITPHLLEGDEEFPDSTTAENVYSSVPVSGGSSETNAETTAETVSEQAEVMTLSSEISTAAVSGTEKEISGTLGIAGAVKDYSIDISGVSLPSKKALRLIAEVIPENENDIFSIYWMDDALNNLSAFRSHYIQVDGKEIQYITGTLETGHSFSECRYQVKFAQKSSSSQGKFTVRVYTYVCTVGDTIYEESRTDNEPLYGSSVAITPDLNQAVQQTGVISHRYDRDTYKVKLFSGQKLTVTLDCPEGKNYYVAIYDNDCTGEKYTLSQFMDGWSGENAKHASIKANRTGNYMVLVYGDFYNPQYSASEEYTLNFYRRSAEYTGDYEVNDDFTHADNNTTFTNAPGTPDSRAQTISFTIDSPVDVDRYAVTMNAGDKLSIYMKLPSGYTDSTMQYRIEVHEALSDGVYMCSSYNNPGSSHDKSVTYIAEKSGTYYAAVRSLTNEYDCTLKGQLYITKTPSASMDTYEKTWTIAGITYTNDFIFTNVLEINETRLGHSTASEMNGNEISSKIDNELDMDWYEMTPESSSTKKLTLDSSNLSMILLGNDMGKIANSTTIQHNFTAGETYYIGIYMPDDASVSSESYTLKAYNMQQKSDLVFETVDWGTFVYDNDPEYLTDDDMADYNLGNRLLMSADGLTGVVDFQSSHSVKPYMLKEGSISLDILLYNPTSETVTVEVDSIGYQAPYENSLNGKTDWTTTNWACLQAWADFLKFDIKKKMLIGDLKENYEEYSFKDASDDLYNKGVYVIEPGKTVWMFGDDSCLKMTKELWSPFNIVSRIKISDGGAINMGFAAFRNRANVFSPESARLIYDVVTQRSYPAEYAVCSHECNCSYEGKVCEHVCVKEHDVNGKPKGIATSVAEVNTNTSWTITDSSKYYTPTVYNYSNPKGYTLGGTSDDYWITHFNPNADIYGGKNSGVESDIIPLYFDDKDENGNIINSWIFDNRHRNPLSGNNYISGAAPVTDAMPLGNYGVVERYKINIINTTKDSKLITYFLNTASHAIITYKVDNTSFQRKIKLGELFDSEEETIEEFENRKKKDIFSIEIEPQKTSQLILEVILPNADAGGLKHQLKCE